MTPVSRLVMSSNIEFSGKTQSLLDPACWATMKNWEITEIG